MDLGARIGWGIVIYAIVFLVWAGTGIYGWTQGGATYAAQLIALTVVCTWAGSQLKFRQWKDIVPYSIGWAIIFVALDSIFVVPLQGWGWYGEWWAWTTYVLVAVLPLLAPRLRRKTPTPHGPWES